MSVRQAQQRLLGNHGVVIAGLIILAYALLVLALRSFAQLEIGVAVLAWVPVILVPLALIYPDILLGLFVAHTFKFVSLLVLDVSIESAFVGEPLLPPIVIVLSVLVRRRKIRIPLGPVVAAQFLLYALFVVGIMRAGFSNEAVTKVWQFSYSNVMPFVCPLLFVRDQKRLRNMVVGFWLGCMIWAIGGQLLGPREAAARLSWVGMGSIGLGRASAVGSLFALCAFLVSSRIWIRSVGACLAVWLLCLAVFTGTRGVLVAYVLAGATTLVAWSIGRSSRRALAFVSVLGAALIVLAVYLAPPEVRTRLVEPSSYAGELYASFAGGQANRLWIYHSSWNMLLSSPIMGLGPNAFQHELLYPHNLFLETATELGLIGAGVLAFFAYRTARYAWDIVCGTRGDDAVRQLTLVVLGSLVFYLVEAQFSADIVGNREIWFFAGVICALYSSAVARHAQWHGGQQLEAMQPFTRAAALCEQAERRRRPRLPVVRANLEHSLAQARRGDT